MSCRVVALHYIIRWWCVRVRQWSLGVQFKNMYYQKFEFTGEFSCFSHQFSVLLHFPDVSSHLLCVLFSELITSLTPSVLSLLPLHQRGRLRDSADESGLGELRHTAALCPAGEQDPAALTPACCAHRSGRGRGGCKNTPVFFFCSRPY